MNNKFVILLISTILIISITFVKCDDFDQSKKAEFSFYCDTNCDSDNENPDVVTLDVGSCQSYSDHCQKNPQSINIFTSYNITTQLYTFNASSPSNAQCTGGISGYPDQTVSCDQCFTFMGGNRATLRCSDSSTLLSSTLFVISLALFVLLF
ncbi:hypothetical protein DDB_G0278577 [Dictyostelium discoideum AX4]|uniref:Transmembrane protein n=1 Tax=Dictyostelium discoideum TaxID=44689 RepID=Q54XU6_DICDI|nr:hypothetical protein DDB_G0278577 [Dictyostelium discoideum AX4]EAL68461.1 hypothetical protein DDB_G0278577 [Dictyostelium discoideum AX4]|eukprot:XP_642456.1 hypothetical protein DDB_G0278577 [Dictyostelium discoideum AX4]